MATAAELLETCCRLYEDSASGLAPEIVHFGSFEEDTDGEETLGEARFGEAMDEVVMEGEALDGEGLLLEHRCLVTDRLNRVRCRRRRRTSIFRGGRFSIGS